jgi:hypothetical protein
LTTIEQCKIVGQEVEPSACDYAGYSLLCSSNEETETFTIEYSGDPLSLTSSPMFPVYTLGSGTNPLDANNSGIPVPISPFTIMGTGLLVVGWRLKKLGCPEETIYRQCYIKGKANVQICNPEEITGPIVTALQSLETTISECCDKCDCAISTQCTGIVNNGVPQYAQLIISLSGANCDGAILILTDPNNAVVSPVAANEYQLTVEGDYTISIETADGCTDSQTYKFCWPVSGGLNPTPPTFTPIPNI